MHSYIYIYEVNLASNMSVVNYELCNIHPDIGMYPMYHIVVDTSVLIRTVSVLISECVF